jgi:rSAM/selenodomain-associated transferase 1
MVLDVLERCNSLPDTDLLLFYDDQPGSRDYFASLGTRASLHPQAGSDLGARMENAFSRAFGLGYRQVVIIGTDSPDLPRHHLLEAFQTLEGSRDLAVFGPTEDGGYCLLGLTSPHGAPFAGIPWSTPEVLETSLQKCREAGLPSELLPPWYDIDTVADLFRPSLLESVDEAPRTLRYLLGLKLHPST